MVTLNILKATVLLTNGTDRVGLLTDRPCPYVVEALPSQPPLEVQFDVTADKGVEYCRNLGLEPEVINARSEPFRFRKSR